MKKNIIEEYCKVIEKQFNCSVEEAQFSKKYILNSKDGHGDLTHIKLDDGFDIFRMEIKKQLSFGFDNRGYDEDILEVGYCYGGTIIVEMLPSRKKAFVSSGDIFIYKMNNSEEKFNFYYHNAKTISISMSCNMIQRATLGNYKVLTEISWNEELNALFQDEVLMIERSCQSVEKIARELNDLVIDNMMAYMLLKSKALEMIVTIVHEKSTSKKLVNTESETYDKKALDLAISIIDKEVERVTSVKWLSDQVALSSYKLQKGFKESVNMTVYAYIKERRITKAEKLLKESTYTVLEIANQVGYENPSKFAHIFKKHFGVSPLKYRQLKRP